MLCTTTMTDVCFFLIYLLINFRFDDDDDERQWQWRAVGRFYSLVTSFFRHRQPESYMTTTDDSDNHSGLCPTTSDNKWQGIRGNGARVQSFVWAPAGEYFLVYLSIFLTFFFIYLRWQMIEMTIDKGTRKWMARERVIDYYILVYIYTPLCLYR
jgi:hypothetical protein